MPIEVLNAVRYTHKASLNCREQSFLVGFTIFSNILLIFSVGYLNLPTSLRMVERCNFVSDFILLHELVEKSVAEVLPPIADDGTWSPKTCKHIFFHKLKQRPPPMIIMARCKHSMIISFASNGLHPFGNVVNCHKDEKVPINMEGNDEVVAPNIKEFHNKDRVRQHHIPSSYAPQLLASLTG